MAAARSLFAERGLDASLDDVAARAGVGVGTLYRRFPAREALIQALFDERTKEQVARLRAAVAADDAWPALVTMLETTCADLANDRGLRQLLLSTEHGHDQIAAAREQLHPLTAQLVARAQEQGQLREDFAATDVPVLLLITALSATSPARSPLNFGGATSTYSSMASEPARKRCRRSLLP